MEVENDDETENQSFDSKVCHVQLFGRIQSLIDGQFYDVNSQSIFRLLNPSVIEGSMTNLQNMLEIKMTMPDLQASVNFIFRDNWFKQQFRIGFTINEEISMDAEIDLAKEKIEKSIMLLANS